MHNSLRACSPYRNLHGAVRVDRSPNAEPHVELPEPRAPGGFGGEALVGQFTSVRCLIYRGRACRYRVGCRTSARTRAASSSIAVTVYQSYARYATTPLRTIPVPSRVTMMALTSGS